MLIDEQYGASVAELASHSAGAVSLCMPIEASGEEWFAFAYGEDWQRHAAFFAADHAKVLVRDNPGLDPGLPRAASQAAGPGLGVGSNSRPVLDRRAAGASHRRRPGRDRGQHGPLRRRTAARAHRGGHGIPAGPRRGTSDLEGRGPRPARRRRRGGGDGATRRTAGTLPRASAGTPRTTSSSTGCRSSPRFRAGPGSRSAAASGGMPLHAHLHHHRHRRRRPGAVSATPTWTTPATTSRPGRGCCPPNPIRRCDGTARSAATTAPRQAPHEAKRRSHVRERSRRVQDATTMLNCCMSPRPRGLNESRSARPVVSERPCIETSRRWLAVTNVMVVF